MQLTNLIIALILGAILFLLVHINLAVKKDDFTWKIFWKRNIFSVLINLCVGFIFILAKDEPLLQVYFPITIITMAFTGYAGSELWKKILGIVDPEKKTFVGLNKK